MSPRGFTLIELVMTIVIAGVILIPLLMTFANVGKENPTLDNLNISLTLAESKMEAVLGKSYGNISSEAKTAVGGNFADYYTQVVVHNVTSTDAITPVEPTDYGYKWIKVAVTSANFPGSIEVTSIATDVTNP